MFTYIDPQPESPRLEELLEEYWNLMPEYQVAFQLVLDFDCAGSSSFWKTTIIKINIHLIVIAYLSLLF